MILSLFGTTCWALLEGLFNGVSKVLTRVNGIIVIAVLMGPEYVQVSSDVVLSSS